MNQNAWHFVMNRSQGVREAYQRAQSRPSWITRATLYTFLIVIGLPILVLFITAIFLAFLVFGCLSLVNALLTGVRGFGSGRRDRELTGGGGGRENVRVIRPDSAADQRD